MTLLTAKQQYTKPKIGLAVDNDKAGKIFLNKMQNYFGNISNCTPTTKYGKDWNATLKGIEKKILSRVKPVLFIVITLDFISDYSIILSVKRKQRRC